MHPQVDAVEEGARDARAIPLHRVGQTGAFGAGIAVVSARAGVHRGDEHEARRVGGRAAGPGDGDRALLERLAQRVEDARVELAKLIEEQATGVRKRLKLTLETKPSLLRHRDSNGP